MNNTNNKLIEKGEIENLVNKYIDIYYVNLQKKKDDPYGLDDIILKAPVKRYVKINSIENIQKAFIHKSFWNITNTYDETDACSSIYLNKELFGDYEKSEFRGDKVIDLITLDYICDIFPEKEVGFLTEMKSRIVRKESLANLGEQLGFKEYILFSSHIEKITKKDTGRDNKRFLEDIFESFIGKLYIDQGYDKEIIKPFLLGVYQTFVDFDYIVKNDTNHKTSLLKLFHAQKFGSPVYTDLYFTGPVINREFVSVVLLEKSLIANVTNVPRKYPNYDKQKKFTSTFTNRLLEEIKNQQDQVDLSENGSNVNLKSLIVMLDCDFTDRLPKSVAAAFSAKQKELLLLMNNTKLVKPSPLEYLEEMSKTHVLVGVGKGSTKKEAEQKCSLDALDYFRLL